MKNKGFTLAELLGVIVIISIILLLVMIPITRNIQKGSETIYDSQLKIIKLGTENWISENINSLPQNEGEKVTLTIGTLKQEGMLEMDLSDPVTGECIPNNTEVIITKTNSGYDINVNIDSGTDECLEIDNAAPIIYLNGEALMYVSYGGVWTDPGATAKTSTGVPITNITKVISGSGTSIDTNGFNTYEITYSATDKGITVSAKRTVIIHDTTAPTITVPEDTVIPSTQATFDALEGVTATDNADGDITSKIKVTGNVTPGVLGEYILTYEVEDNAGNKTSVTRKITIEDKTKPTATATIVGNPLNSDKWAKANFQVKIKIKDEGGSGPAGFRYCKTTSTTCTPDKNVSEVVNNITVDTQSSTNYICIIPYDHAGNDGTKQCFGPYKLDKTKPVPTLTAAASQFNSDGWAKANVAVTLTTSDTGSSNVESYTYCTSTTAKCTPNNKVTSTSGSFTLDTNGKTNYVCVYTTDYADNQSDTVCSGPHKLDKLKPTLTLTVNDSQFNSDDWATSNISATVSTSDTGTSNVKSYTYCTNASKTCTPNTTVSATSGTITISSESETNYVCAYSTDYAGNNSTTECKGPYKLDKTGPTLTIPGDTTVTLGNTSFDLMDGVSATDNVTDDSSIKITYSGDFNVNYAGTYTITYTATDAAGKTTTKTRKITVSKTIKIEFKINGASKLTGTSTSSTSSITEECTITSGTTCNIKSPAITASTNTPTIVGFNTSSTATTSSWNQSTTKAVSASATYHAITKKNAITLNASWNANGAELSSTSKLECTLAATYNGTAQATTCTVTAPTITRGGWTIIGFNTSSSSQANNSNYNTSTKKLTLSSSNTGRTWYAITKYAYTLTANFTNNINKAKAATTETKTCTATRWNTTGTASCSITAPTISTGVYYNIIGWNTSESATTSSLNSGASKTLTASAPTTTNYYTIVTYKTGYVSLGSTGFVCHQNVLYQRTGPDSSYGAYGSLHQGDTIVVKGENNGWYYYIGEPIRSWGNCNARSGSHTGYTYSGYISFSYTAANCTC